MAKPFNAELAKVLLGKVQFESAPKIPDSSCKLISLQRRDCCCLFVKICCRCHIYNPLTGFTFRIQLILLSSHLKSCFGGFFLILLENGKITYYWHKIFFVFFRRSYNFVL